MNPSARCALQMRRAKWEAFRGFFLSLKGPGPLSRRGLLLLPAHLAGLSSQGVHGALPFAVFKMKQWRPSHRVASAPGSMKLRDTHMPLHPRMRHAITRRALGRWFHL